LKEIKISASKHLNLEEYSAATISPSKAKQSSLINNEDSIETMKPIIADNSNKFSKNKPVKNKGV
jgi:hypothetical protein